MSTEQLIETLIESQRETNRNMSELSSKMGELISIEAGRVERDKNQTEKNKEYNTFIKINSEPLIRVRRWQARIDKYVDKVLLFIGIAIAGLLGFNFLG